MTQTDYVRDMKYVLESLESGERRDWLEREMGCSMRANHSNFKYCKMCGLLGSTLEAIAQYNASRVASFVAVLTSLRHYRSVS